MNPRTPWGCPPPTPNGGQDPVVFHAGTVIVHTLSTSDTDVIAAVAQAAGRGENLHAWATACFRRGALLSAQAGHRT